MDYLLPESKMSESSSGLSAPTEPEFVEMSMVLPAWQMEALAQLAARQKISIGQLLRRSIAKLVRDVDSPVPANA
jgi:hypothetical protein